MSAAIAFIAFIVGGILLAVGLCRCVVHAVDYFFGKTFKE